MPHTLENKTKLKSACIPITGERGGGHFLGIFRLALSFIFSPRNHMPSPIAREHDVAAQRLVCKLAEREDLGGPPDRCDQLRHLRDELGVKQSFMAGLPLSSFGVDTSDDVCPVGK